VATVGRGMAFGARETPKVADAAASPCGAGQGPPAQLTTHTHDVSVRGQLRIGQWGERGRGGGWKVGMWG